MVFEDAEEALSELIDVDVSAQQIQRVCKYYGEQFDALIRANCEAVIPRIEKGSKDEMTYVMVDGSMLLTRDDAWKEMKLGRIFQDRHLIDIQLNRRTITDSVYVSHLGCADAFFAKFERFLTSYQKKIILADGAPWIWKWAEDNYPGAIQILDFYHAQEKLYAFARDQFKEDDKRKAWVEEQKAKLLDNQVDQVIATISACKARSKPAQQSKESVIRYYTEHNDRMHYKTYLEKGLLIGSGPIEAAHRSVVHQRLKLSGQKWSIPGAQAVSNLRCYQQSNSWNRVLQVISAAA